MFMTWECFSKKKKDPQEKNVMFIKKNFEGLEHVWNGLANYKLLFTFIMTTGIRGCSAESDD